MFFLTSYYACLRKRNVCVQVQLITLQGGRLYTTTSVLSRNFYRQNARILVVRSNYLRNKRIHIIAVILPRSTYIPLSSFIPVVKGSNPAKANLSLADTPLSPAI